MPYRLATPQYVRKRCDLRQLFLDREFVEGSKSPYNYTAIFFLFSFFVYILYHKLFKKSIKLPWSGFRVLSLKLSLSAPLFANNRQSTGTILGLVEYVRFERRLILPRDACSHYTTYSMHPLVASKRRCALLTRKDPKG